MSGTLGLSSPWARQAIPQQRERDEIAARIPEGYTIGVYCNSTGTMYGIRVVKHGATIYDNRVVWGGDEGRKYFRDVRVGITTALGWLEGHLGTVDRRESSRQQRDDAIDAVKARSAAWRRWAVFALYHVATRHSELTSDEVWWALDAHQIPHPAEPRAMGPVMLHGARSRWIEPTERFRVADNPATSRNHGRPQRIYRSCIYGLTPPAWPDLSRPQQLTLLGADPA